MNLVRGIFEYAAEHNISMTTDHDRLDIKTHDKSSLTDDFLQLTRKHKQEIIGIIMARKYGPLSMEVLRGHIGS